METLFRATSLEARFPLNMNVLSRGKVPNVLPLNQVLREWLEHRKDVLVRRSRHRLAEIERRLEILAGYLIAYLNIDEVIRIIREEDEPKPVMMARWSLTDTQAEAILNMRLRALRKLEEVEIRKEFDGLTQEKSRIEGLLASNAKQWQTIKGEVKKLRDGFGPATPLGRRRTTFADAPDHDLADVHSDAEDDPMFLRDRIVHRCDAFLNGQGASNCVKGVRELGEYAVPRRIDDAPPVLSDFAVRDLAM